MRFDRIGTIDASVPIFSLRFVLFACRRVAMIALPKPAAELLVSVRDAAEASLALEGGADWIDVKQPERGSLGRPEAAAIRQVVARIAGRAPVSVALGELAELRLGEVASLAGVARVKLGLAGCRDLPDWPRRLAQLAERLPPATSLVAVQYADWQACGAPAPEQLVDELRCVACSALLIDTCGKQSGGLFDWMTDGQIVTLLGKATLLGMSSVLAGGLTGREFGRALAAGAEIVAVRGAACCDGSRTAQVKLERVFALRRQLDAVVLQQQAQRDTTKNS